MRDESETSKELREPENSGTLQNASCDDNSTTCVMTKQEPVHTNNEEKTQGMDSDIFKKIFEFSTEIIALINQEGIIIDVNNRLHDWLGYTPEEIIGQNFLNLPFLSLDGKEQVKNIFKERTLGNKPPTYEFDFITKNGARVVGLVHTVPMKNEQGIAYQDLVMISDITQKKEAEEKLQENKAKYERLFHSSPDFIAEIDEDGMFLAVNAAMAKSLGVTPEQLIGKDSFDILPKDIAEKRALFARKSLAEGTVQVCEDERAGRHFYTMFVPGKTNVGKKTVQVIAKDITIIKTTQKYLQESEKKYRQLVETLHEGIWMIDSNAITTFVNPRMAEILGYTAEEMLGKHLFSFMDESGKKLAAENLERRQHGIKEQHDFEFIRKDGSRIYALLETGPITDETGTYQGAIAGVQDITERKRNEENLRYQANLLENVSDAIIATDLQYNIQYWNKTAEKQYGWTAAEVIGHPLEMFIINDYLGCSLDIILQKISQDGYWQGEVTQNRRDGVRIPILSTLSKVTNAAGQTTGFIAVNRDITERKRVEDAIQKSENRHRASIELTQLLAWTTTGDGEVVEDIPTWRKFTGQSYEAVKGTGWTEALHPDDIEHTIQIWKKSVETKSGYETEYRIRRFDGVYREFLARGIPVFKEDGSILEWTGICIDITEHKKVESEINYIKKYNENILESNPNPMIVVKGTQIEYVNKSFVSIFGETKNEYIARNLKDVVPSESLPVFEDLLQEDGVAKELKFRGKDFIVHSFVIKKAEEEEEEEEEEEARSGIIFQDITERKRAEDKLFEISGRLQLATDSAKAGVWDWNIQTNEMIWDDRMLELYGFTRENFPGGVEAWRQGLHPDDSARANAECEAALHGEQDFDTEFRVLRPDGTVIHIKANGLVTRDHEGKPLRMLGLNIDITERKQAEDALKESEEKLRSIVENSSDQIFMLDEDCKFLSINKAVAEISGHSPQEMIGKSLFEMFPENIAAQFSKNIKNVFDTGKSFFIEEKMIVQGRELYNSTSLNPVKSDGGRVIAVTGIVRDITEHKRLEADREKILGWQQSVNTLQQSLLAPAPLEDKLKMITDKIVSLFDADFCRIWLTQPGDLCEQGCIHAEVTEGPHICRFRDRCLRLMASSGRYTHTDGKTHRRVPFGCYKIGRVASGEEHKFITNDVQNDSRVHNTEWARELGLVSFAGYQLHVPGGDTLGVLALFAKHPISAIEDTILDELSNTVARIVRQAKTEKAVQESEEHHRILFECACDALMIIEPPSWKFISANQATVELFKANNKEEFTSLGPWDVSPERQPDGRDSAEKAKDMIETAMRNGSCFFEWTHKRINGEDFPATVLLSRVEQGGKVFLQATVRDITVQKQLEIRLKEKIDDLESATNEVSKKNQELQVKTENLMMTNQELHVAREQLGSLNQDLEQRVKARTVEIEKLLKQKDEFIGQLGHDLKTPLTPLNTLLPIIKKREQDPKLVELLDATIQNVNYMKNLVVKTLQLARLNSSNIILAPTDFSLSVEIKHSLESMQSTLQETGIIVESNLDDSIIVNADVLHIKELIDNLFSNAAKFTPPGGKITVTTVKEQDSVITSIQDTGVGLTVEQLEHLFEEFYKADPSRHDLQSTGLGLAICKRIVEKHGGKIWAESSGLGKGAAFHFTMKISDNKLIKPQKDNILDTRDGIKE